jgi:hypothetical protein
MLKFDKAPELTMPEQPAEALRQAYSKADVILEYGSGGSTVMAAGMPGKTVFSVESGQEWAQALEDWFKENPPVAKSVMIHHADIGPTKEWGWPVSDEFWQDYASYPLSIWSREGFVHPDVVLIDGRFRAACFLAVQFQITRPVTVFWDDYRSRRSYHEVERYGAPVAMKGRMAKFKLVPKSIPPADLAWIMAVFARKF